MPPNLHPGTLGGAGQGSATGAAFTKYQGFGSGRRDEEPRTSQASSPPAAVVPATA